MFNSVYGELRGDLRTTAHMAQTMHLLLRNTLELEAEIAQELAQNPALEVVDELRCPECGRRLRRLPCPTCSQHHADSDLTVFFSPRGSLNAGRFNYRGDPNDRDDDENLALQRIEQPVSLADYVLRQVGPTLESDDERRIARYILDRLDDNGLLPEHPAEIARYLHVPLADVEAVLARIQQCDPPGVAATSRTECLLLQLDSLAETCVVPPLCRPLVSDEGHWHALAHAHYDTLAHALHSTPAQVIAAAEFIRANLTPYPARANWGPGSERTVVSPPDAAIYPNPNRTDGGLIIEIFTPGNGYLRVSPEIKALLRQLPDNDDFATWRGYVDRATLLTKCLQQRNHTLRRILTFLVTKQRAYVTGHDSDLTPLTRATIADELGLHESTVSRAVANKFVALPNGKVVPLSKFFDRSLAVRTALSEIIADEPHALSDNELADRLREQGYVVARRTVAKYRQMLGILPASMRRPAPRPAPPPA